MSCSVLLPCALCYWQELIKLKRKEAELHQITAQARGIQTRLKYSNSELESVRKKSIPACQAVSFSRYGNRSIVPTVQRVHACVCAAGDLQTGE